jgi:transcriptional regulator with PAS, ATPase and Fis domain
MTKNMKLKRAIRTLERQRREITEILRILRHLDKFGVNRPDHTISLDDFDKHLVQNALRQANDNKSEAARLLNITRDRLRYKVTKYRLNQK